MVKGKATLVNTEFGDEETLCRETGNIYKALAFYPKNRHIIFKIIITPLAQFISPPGPFKGMKSLMATYFMGNTFRHRYYGSRG